MADWLSSIKALTFDTGGTVLDWHKALHAAFSAAGARHGLERDWHTVVNDHRRGTMKRIVGQVQPAFTMDDVHRRMVDVVAEVHGLDAFTSDERDVIATAWHRTDCWPDFPPALARLRSKLPCVSFTLLPVRLILDVSRRNGIAWDMVVSCEMIGVYKTDPRSYATCARWLQFEPSELLMVACHNFDLDAAKKAGYRTAFVRRPDEWGPSGPPDPNPNPIHDLVFDGFSELADALGC